MQIQHVVDEIRTVVSCDDWRWDDRLRELAAEYARACREANERLRRCEEFLQRGLKAEAIQIAEAEPNLLDLAALLDFPGRSQWDDLAVMYELPRAESLLIPVVSELNAAYNEQLSLDGLLKKHRLLALARAPLPMRLGVLRRLAEADLESLFWEDDVRAMERVRLEQIEREASEARRRDDVATLDRLLQ
ncbi:MAG TPA: hypothetical protein EYP14_04140, partial [Planctomycetaceae bacterium]|nr:hypothetical protein [Planctomycetaceae bacterium]